MGRCRLGHAVVWFGLEGMNQIGKLHGILDEEHRYVVADQFPVAFVGIELHGKTMGVACGVFRAAFAGDCGKTREHGCDFAFLGEWCRVRVLGQCVVGFEVAVRSRATGMDEMLLWGIVPTKSSLAPACFAATSLVLSTSSLPWSCSRDDRAGFFLRAMILLQGRGVKLRAKSASS